MKANVQFGAVSHTGRVRPNNEDSFGAAPDLGLYVVSDGMGGAASGEVASRLTVDTVLAHCRRSAELPTEVYGGNLTGTGVAADRLGSAIRLANLAVHLCNVGRRVFPNVVQLHDPIQIDPSQDLNFRARHNISVAEPAFRG